MSKDVCLVGISHVDCPDQLSRVDVQILPIGHLFLQDVSCITAMPLERPTRRWYLPVSFSAATNYAASSSIAAFTVFAAPQLAVVQYALGLLLCFSSSCVPIRSSIQVHADHRHQPPVIAFRF